MVAKKQKDERDKLYAETAGWHQEQARLAEEQMGRVVDCLREVSGMIHPVYEELKNTPDLSPRKRKCYEMLGHVDVKIGETLRPNQK